MLARQLELSEDEKASMLTHFGREIRELEARLDDAAAVREEVVARAALQLAATEAATTQATAQAAAADAMAAQAAEVERRLATSEAREERNRQEVGQLERENAALERENAALRQAQTIHDAEVTALRQALASSRTECGRLTEEAGRWEVGWRARVAEADERAVQAQNIRDEEVAALRKALESTCTECDRLAEECAYRTEECERLHVAYAAQSHGAESEHRVAHALAASLRMLQAYARKPVAWQPNRPNPLTLARSPSPAHPRPRPNLPTQADVARLQPHLLEAEPIGGHSERLVVHAHLLRQELVEAESWVGECVTARRERDFAQGEARRRWRSNWDKERGGY
jgi:hypothetical protein